VPLLWRAILSAAEHEIFRHGLERRKRLFEVALRFSQDDLVSLTDVQVMIAWAIARPAFCPT
jgi:hypothetical protein